MQLKNRKQNRATRVRASVKTSGRPRLTIHRSNMHIWAQIIDDSKHETLVSLNTKAIKVAKGDTKTVRSTKLGEEIAKLALAKNITKIVFDRGAYKYHGRVKAVAEAARTAGLEF
jgi:large subunit ribosomal protein L18